MTNQEFYEKYGPEEGQRRIDAKNKARREWWKRNKGYNQEWIEQNRQKWNEYARRYQSKHREEQRERVQKYHDAPEGRCTNLLTSYRQFDAERFGTTPQLTREQVLMKTMTEGCRCVYCGKETRWTELGLDRISNSRPHHTWNTVCCCKKCNNKRNRKTFEEFLEYIGLTFEEWMTQNNAEFSDGLTICY